MPSSIHSGISGRSIGSYASTLTTRSKRSYAESQAPKQWWRRRPLLKTAYFLDLQRGSYAAAIFTTIESVILLSLAIFDLYCLIEARPGSRHFRSFGFSFLFVYSGNRYVRYGLILTSFILSLFAIVLFYISCRTIPALKEEIEKEFRPWLYLMVVFIGFRTLATIFQSLANDLYFTYHQVMLLLWLILIPLNIFAFLVVLSNYQELDGVGKIEKLAQIRASTLSSLHGSRTLSHLSVQSLNNSIYGRQIYGATVNSNPSYMRAAANINQQPYARAGSNLYNNTGSIYSGASGLGVSGPVTGSGLPMVGIGVGAGGPGSTLSTPTPSVLGHHASTPSLRGGTNYTIPLEMFNLNRPPSVTSSNQQINQEFI